MKPYLTATSAYSANSRTAKEMAKLPSRISPNRSVQRIRHLIIVFDSLPYELAMWVFFMSVTVMLFSWWAVAASVVWAPFGALICALIAWRRGLNPRRYAVAGAAHSVLFFLPWVYLAARMLGVRIPKTLVVLGCAVAYAAWLQGIAQYSFMHWATDDDYRMLLAWLFNIGMAIASLALITRVGSWKASRLRSYWAPPQDAPSRDAPPHPAYLAPFAGFLCGAAVQFALLWADGIFG